MEKVVFIRYSDTGAEAEKVQVELIRQASVAKRISRLRSLSQTVVQLSRRAIMRANPGITEQGLNVMFVANHYGNELAGCLRKYLMDKVP